MTRRENDGNRSEAFGQEVSKVRVVNMEARTAKELDVGGEPPECRSIHELANAIWGPPVFGD
jgi:hypothetical protein